MGKRRKTRQKNQQRKWLKFGLVLAVLTLLTVFRDHIPRELTDALSEYASGAFQEGSGLEVHYLDVGQGDCTLILCDGHAMLIDAGDNDKGTAVQSYLESQGVTELDYVIGTHPDADHIGGLDVILYKFDCQTVLMPDFEKDTRTYDDVIQTMKQKRYENTLPRTGETYELGSAVFTIVAPNGEYGDNANDYSIGVLLQHGGNRFLFTGDAEEASEADMLENGANTEEFLNAADPDYMVISCGQDNSYGHPHAEVMNRLRIMGISVFRTDEQGTIVAHSDGTEITFNMSPDESWKAGEPKS